MGLLWNVSCLLLGSLLLSNIFVLYYGWNPPVCGGNEHRHCIGPLFEDDEKVDVHVFTSPLRSVDDWRSQELELIHSELGVVLSDSGFRANVTATVHGVLFAHVLLVRAGHPAARHLHERLQEDMRPKYQRVRAPRAMYSNLVYASAKLTKRVPRMRIDRKALLRHNGTDVTFESEPMWPWGTAFAIGGTFTEPSFKMAALRFLTLTPLLNATLSSVLAAQRSATLSPPPPPPPPPPPSLHFKPRLSLRFVNDQRWYEASKIGDSLAAPRVRDKVRYDVKRGTLVGEPRRYTTVVEEAHLLRYTQPFYVQDNVRQYELYPVGKNGSNITLHIEFETQSRTGWQVSQLLLESLKAYAQMPALGLRDEDLDEMRDFVSRGVLRIALTYAIGFAQLVLSTLAFRSDIAFFRGRNDFSGLSSRSLLSSFAISLIIFLYVFDSEFASRLVVWPMGFGVAIDAWKVSCRLRLKLQWAWLLPWGTVATGSASAAALSEGEGKGEENAAAAAAERRLKTEETTEAADVKAMRYLKYTLVPLVLCSSIHALLSYSYKSWWSWMISSLADASYAFGFLNMCPQIFVNYRLRSVAHLPWRTMVYKAFNTFIDDAIAFGGLFAMPEKHKWMTLRDDLVFFIFLYQRWLYPVDRTRPDEFGYTYTTEDDGVADDVARIAEDAKRLKTD